jgi:AraC family transcriptional regulator of adaptative response / DNA-3-methyladenine glycosylase II
VGQQVSTQAARTVLARLAESVNGDAGQTVFPSAAGIAAMGNAHFAMPGRRRESLLALCRYSSTREDDLDLDALCALPGVGPWTAAMVAMRGTGQPDTFPEKDLGLEKAWAQLPGPDTPLKHHAANWRPWRSYAANLLWRSLSP